MICDHQASIAEGPCRNSVARAPRVVVPARGALSFMFRPLRMFTTLHYCELHKGAVKVEDLLTPRVKRDFEMAARRKWPFGMLPDFEQARIEYVLVTTPEYRAFLAALGHGGIMRAALGVARLAG